MGIKASQEPWKKYAAYPGQPAFVPGSRLLPASWQQLRQIVAEFEGPPRKPGGIRACGSHWSFSETAVSPQVMVETNDPDERDNAAAPRLNRPLYDLLPEHLSAEARRFFESQPGVAFDATVLSSAVSVVHVEAGMKIAELYSFLDLDDGGGNHLGRRYPQYRGPWAMPTLGGAGGQTVAGAVQTGTHGGDVHLPPIADAVVAMHLVGAGGRHFWVEKTTEPWGRLVDDPLIEATYPHIEVVRNDELLHAAQVACGRFGIIYSVVLKVVRQYALFEDRVASTWSTVRPWLDNAGVVGGSWFTQIIVNPLGQMSNPGEHSAWVTRRWRLPLIAAGAVPAGRAERVGANAGREVTFDPTDPNARDSFMNRVCEGAHPIRVAIDDLVQVSVAARDKALLTAATAQAGISAAVLLGLPPPPHLVAAQSLALAAAATAQASIFLLEIVKTLVPQSARVNEALGDLANFLAAAGQYWILRAIADDMMGRDQRPRTATAISYALMDIHNYRDWVCSKNGDSIEVFFDAWTPDAKNFLDLVFKRVQELEAGQNPWADGERMAFPGYIAIRFTQGTKALMGMQRWGHAVSFEIASVNASKGTRRLLQQVHDDALAAVGPGGPRASLHWGQKNTVGMSHVESAFGAWIPGGRLARWRHWLSELTRNGRDSTFSTEFTRAAGLEVVQPRIYALTASASVACAGSHVVLNWDAENNPPGTTARLVIRPKTPQGAARTLGLPPLAGTMTLELPPGRHEVVLEVGYELNHRELTDQRTVDLRGIVPGDVIVFQFVPSCWQFAGVDRWWVDLNPGGATFAPNVVVENVRVTPSSGGAWRATRPQRPDLVFPGPGVSLPVPDRPAMRNSSWRFLSESGGCSGAPPTLRVEFGLGCAGA